MKTGVKKQPAILQDMFIKEEQKQSHSEDENNDNNDPPQLQEQYNNNQYDRQRPLYNYLYELQKSAINHQNTLDANLIARSFSSNGSSEYPDLSFTTATVFDDHVNNSYILPCPLCETPLEQRLFRQHLDGHYPRDSPVCPVIECGRRFAHPNSVRNHMRIKHTHQWAKMKVMRSSAGPLPSGGLELNKRCEINYVPLVFILFISFCLFIHKREIQLNKGLLYQYNCNVVKNFKCI